MSRNINLSILSLCFHLLPFYHLLSIPSLLPSFPLSVFPILLSLNCTILFRFLCPLIHLDFSSKSYMKWSSILKINKRWYSDLQRHKYTYTDAENYSTKVSYIFTHTHIHSHNQKHHLKICSSSLSFCITSNMQRSAYIISEERYMLQVRCRQLHWPTCCVNHLVDNSLRELCLYSICGSIFRCQSFCRDQICTH